VNDIQFEDNSTELKVLDISRNTNKSIGKAELTGSQEEKLEKLLRVSDKKVSKTIKSFGNSKIGKIVTKKKELNTITNKACKQKGFRNKVYFTTAAAILCTILVFNINTEEVEGVTTDNNYTGTVVSISMNNDSNKLQYNVDKISIRSGDQYINLNTFEWLKTNINTSTTSYSIGDNTYSVSKETSLYNLDISSQRAYVQYSNEESTASKELIFMSDKPSNIDTTGFEKVNKRFFIKDSLLQTKAYTTNYNNSFLMITETLAGGKLNTTSLKPMLGIMDSSITVSEKDNLIDESLNFEIPCEITLKFDELGELKLSELDEVNISPEIVYNRDDDIIRIRNNGEDLDYVYIGSIDNEKLGCNADDLVATNTDGLYIHKDFDKQGYVGYKTFALKTENNLYVIKLNEVAHESLQESLFEQFGIDTKQIEIKKIQRMIDVN
jgi:hypothetical protein